LVCRYVEASVAETNQFTQFDNGSGKSSSVRFVGIEQVEGQTLR
jgi:hypothetical protein